MWKIKFLPVARDRVITEGRVERDISSFVEIVIYWCSMTIAKFASQISTKILTAEPDAGDLVEGEVTHVVEA